MLLAEGLLSAVNDLNTTAYLGHSGKEKKILKSTSGQGSNILRKKLLIHKTKNFVGLD